MPDQTTSGVDAVADRILQMLSERGVIPDHQPDNRRERSMEGAFRDWITTCRNRGMSWSTFGLDPAKERRKRSSQLRSRAGEDQLDPTELSRRVRGNYERRWDQFIRESEVDETAPVSELTLDMLEDHLRVVDLRGTKARTRNSFRLMMRSFLTFCVESDMKVAFLPRDIRLEKEPDVDVRVPTDDEARALLKAPDTSTWIGRRDRMVLTTFIATGVRRNELRLLKVKDIVPPAILVRDGKASPSTARRERRVYMPELLEHRMSEWMVDWLDLPAEIRDTGYLFPSQRLTHRGSPKRGALAANAITRIVGRHSMAAGIDPPLGPHDLRRYCATSMARDVIDPETGDVIRRGATLHVIREVLGHAHVSTTERYVKLGQDQIEWQTREFSPITRLEMDLAAED